MPRIRSIKPEFWKSESIAALPFRTRLTFVGLWTYVDDNGVGLDNYKLIAAELFGLEEDPREARANVREDLARLHSAGRILRYTVAGKRYLAIVNWDEHQKIDKPGKPRHPAPAEEDVTLLSREDAWALDAPKTPSIQDSRECRESVAPGTGIREQGIREQGAGDSAKADAADASSSAQGAFPGMPAAPINLPAVQTRGSAVRPDGTQNPQDVVAAYVDGAKSAGMSKPSGPLCARVGKRAKELIEKEGKNFSLLVDAAFEMGGSEYNDLDVAYRKAEARSKGLSNNQARGAGPLARRSTSAVRAEQGLSVADELDRMHGHGAYAETHGGTQ